MSEGGRVVIPAEIREKMGLKAGDTLYWEFVDGEARLSTRRTRIVRKPWCGNLSRRGYLWSMN
ncbi:MAG: AbrB/MazE/SpoVT family DNA-binding domain-containing protein [Rhodocyclaceae bacterium]|nr:AbrB/MazE/SpoVT family DNA-binding domain-containing protein [Rhodocyclaceae bacterium]